MLTTPEIAQASAQPSAIIRITIPRDEIQHAMGPGYQELIATLAAQGIAPAGPWYTHHLRMHPEVFDFELGVPIAAQLTAVGRVIHGQLPAITVIRTVYQGGYESLPDAWGEFDTWIAAQGHTTRPDLWERYIAGPESSSDPANWRTELSRELARR